MSIKNKELKLQTQKDLAWARLNINIDKEIKEEFIKLARANNTDVSKLVRDYAEEYIKAHKPKGDETDTNTKA